MKKLTYSISTISYGLIFMLAILSIIYSTLTKKIPITIISVLIAIVSLDNFFCSCRIKKAGYKAKNHYGIPPFLKNK